MEQDAQSTCPDQEMRRIFSGFLAGVVKLEQLAELGSRYLNSFQQAVELLRRPSIDETSELVQNILKQNETKRVKSYVEAGCINAYDSRLSVTQMNTSLSGLHDHLIKAQTILSELETLMDKAGHSLLATPGDPSDTSDLNFVEDSEQESTSASEKTPLDGSDCASFMAVIFSMVKQDYLMQERVASSLGMKSSPGELESYSLMWSLRPFVNDDIIHEAIRCIG